MLAVLITHVFVAIDLQAPIWTPTALGATYSYSTTATAR